VTRALWVGGLLAALLPAQDTAPANPFTPFDRAAFAAALKVAGATDEQLARFAAQCDAESPAVAAEALVRAVFGEYATALSQIESADPRGVLTLSAVLDGAKDPHLQAHARYWLGRAFLDADDPEGAVAIFSDYLKGSRNRTPFDGDVVFFYGSALARIPERDAAASVLREFVQLFPDAPERYRASANQLVAELEGKLNPLHDIADTMGGVERRIRKTDTGQETQKRQEDVITQLAKIIEQIEEQEKQSSGGGGGNPTSPRQDSNLTPGATQVGNLNKAKDVSDRWGMLKDRERKAIESEAQTKLSGRSRKLVEDYYRKLSRGGAK
jgi:tetratricopeptide (TPR) repeat protein